MTSPKTIKHANMDADLLKIVNHDLSIIKCYEYCIAAKKLRIVITKQVF